MNHANAAQVSAVPARPAAAHARLYSDSAAASAASTSCESSPSSESGSRAQAPHSSASALAAACAAAARAWSVQRGVEPVSAQRSACSASAAFSGKGASLLRQYQRTKRRGCPRGPV